MLYYLSFPIFIFQNLTLLVSKEYTLCWYLSQISEIKAAHTGPVIFYKIMKFQMYCIVAVIFNSIIIIIIRFFHDQVIKQEVLRQIRSTSFFYDQQRDANSANWAKNELHKSSSQVGRAQQRRFGCGDTSPSQFSIPIFLSKVIKCEIQLYL